MYQQLMDLALMLLCYRTPSFIDAYHVVAKSTISSDTTSGTIVESGLSLTGQI